MGKGETMGRFVVLLVVFISIIAGCTYKSRPATAEQVCYKVCLFHFDMLSLNRPVTGPYICTCGDGFRLEYL